jgi:hypothetical protein
LTGGSGIVYFRVATLIKFGVFHFLVLSSTIGYDFEGKQCELLLVWRTDEVGGVEAHVAFVRNFS